MKLQSYVGIGHISMRRRWLGVAAICLVITIFSLARQDVHFLPLQNVKSWLREPPAGSKWIDKGPGAEDKVIVIAKMQNETVDWVYDELQDWQRAIYHMDEPGYILHPPQNVGREAMAYLTFLIDHYYVLPEIVVFLHPHLRGWPEAWHTDAPDYNNVNSVRSLRLEYVREHGYANLRCLGDPGCPAEIQPFRNDTSRDAEMAFADAYIYFFGNNASVPERIGTPCCAQFAVSREQVLQRPQSDYRRYRRWLLDSELTSAVSGRVLEYMWHIIFDVSCISCYSSDGVWACYNADYCSGSMKYQKALPVNRHADL